MSWVYWGVFLSTLILGYTAERNPKSRLTAQRKVITRPDPVLAVMLSLILILVAGLRHGVGTDYWAYYRTRVTDWQTVWNALIRYSEPGIRLLSKITRDISDTGTGLIFLSALITIGIYCTVIYRHSPLYLVSMLVFLFLGDWAGSFNGVRQYLAAAILFAGHRLILERKLAPYLAVVFLASLFHRTALVMILPYFLFTRKPDMTQLVILAVGALVIRLSYDLVFSLIGNLKNTIIDLQDDYMTRDINPLRIAVCFIPIVLYFLSGDRRNMNREQGFYINALFFNAFAMLASAGSAYLGRIGLYTGATVALGYAHLFRMIPGTRNRRIVLLSVMGILLLYWIYSLWGGAFHWIFE